MKNIILINIVLTLTTFSQQNIIYNKIPDSLNVKYGKLVAQEIKKPSFLLYKDPFFVGPYLYKKMKEEKFNLDHCTNITYLINKVKWPGKMANDSTDYFKIWNYFLRNIDVNSFKIMKLNQDEIERYWTRISFHIKEPILIIESKGLRWIIDIDMEGKINWIDLI